MTKKTIPVIVPAAGIGSRFENDIPKQYFKLDTLTVIETTVRELLNSNIVERIIICVAENDKFIEQQDFYNDPKIKIIKGGSTRAQSVLNALNDPVMEDYDFVAVHDAARPNFSIKLLKNITKHLKKNKAVVPIISSNDSGKYKIQNQVYNLNRNNLLLTQTPQAFRFKELYVLARNQKNKITDEASLFINKDHKIKFIPGEKQNNKITYIDDIETSKTYFGIGFDLHKLVKNKKLYLGGVKIPFHSGLKGHSDGDVILHAIIDAILGATRKKDIGTYFPNTKKFKNIRSPKMLKPIMDQLNKTNLLINNLDINLICEQPKVSKFRDKIINSLSKLMTLDKTKINLKGKTVEKLGLIGKEKAIACEVIISITKYD